MTQAGEAHTVAEPVLAVAAGLLIRADGRVLVQQRTGPPALAGLWEFPGGKIESGETPETALIRELHEEIAVVARDVVPWMRVRHRYPERVVLLDVLLVRAWDGEPRALEGQPIDWALPESLSERPMLGANPVIVAALIREPGRDSV